MFVRPFGQLPTGETIDTWTLRNHRGSTVEVLTYGGIVRTLHVPDRDGHLADVVLGFDDLAPYVAGHPYFGAIAGRVAGRIARGRFTLDGHGYQLAVNHPPNHLHGGPEGFHRRVWRATAVEQADGTDSVRLTYRSADGEEGYPGTVDVAVTYTLTADQALEVKAEATTDRATPFSLTHHSYFNLAGENSGTIEDHHLQIEADAYAPTAADLTLLGTLKPVAGTPADLIAPRRLGDVIPRLWQRHGDLYRLRRSVETSPHALKHAARVSEIRTGRVLDVFTTEPFLQLYTGVALPGSKYPSFAGLCLECERYPDALNHPGLDDTLVLRPGQSYRTRTLYAFSTTA